VNNQGYNAADAAAVAGATPKKGVLQTVLQGPLLHQEGDMQVWAMFLKLLQEAESPQALRVNSNGEDPGAHDPAKMLLPSRKWACKNPAELFFRISLGPQGRILDSQGSAR